MHVLRLLRIFVPLLVVAALVAGAIVVLTSRNDLRDSRTHVDTAWSRLRTDLDARYVTLAAANGAVSATPGPLREITGALGRELSDWAGLERQHASVTAEVNAANALESLGRRLIAASGQAPRLVGNTAAFTKLHAYAASKVPASASAFDAAVDSYERERNRPARSVAAHLLGYRSIPSYDASGA